MDKIIAETKNEFYDKIKESGYDIIDDDGKWLILDDGESIYEAEYTQYSDGDYELMLYNINKVKDKETLIEKINEVEPDDYSDWGVEELQELPINLGISIESSRRPVKSGVPGYPDDYIPNKIYYIVVNGSKEYFMNENKARSVAYDLKFESPNVSGPYEETDPEEIAEVIDAGIIRSSRRPVKSARYIATDPETGEVLGSADTYEEAVNEWGENVTITDSEVAENVTSSYEFNRDIVNSVLSQKMTEQEAIQKIASRKDVNIGFAKQIFNNLMNDKSLISSGTMEMASKLNQEFDLNGDLYSWYKDYVNSEGKASTVGGELVRAANQIINEFNETGDGIGYGKGRESVNPAARFIIEECPDYSEVNNISDMLDETDDITYGNWIETFERTFTDYLRDHEELFHKANQEDFWNYAETGDKVASVDEFCIYDDNGNEYWFTRDGDGWVCSNIEYQRKPDYNVNDTFNSGSPFEDEIDDRREPYGFFSKDGFTYNWEGVGEPDDNGEYREWVITDVDRDDLKYHVEDKANANDFEYESVFDENGNEISFRDLF